jgi:hypothetical protein
MITANINENAQANLIPYMYTALGTREIARLNAIGNMNFRRKMFSDYDPIPVKSILKTFSSESLLFINNVALFVFTSLSEGSK